MNKKHAFLATAMAVSLGACSLFCACAPTNNDGDTDKRYDIKSVKIENVDISEFSLYTPNYGKVHYANPDNVFDLTILRDNIEAELDVVLPIATAKLPNKKYIIVEPTGAMDNEFEIKIDGGNVYINGSYNGAYAALDYFVEDYLQSFKTENVKISDSDDKKVTLEKKDIYTKAQLLTVLNNVYSDDDHLIVGEEVGGREFVSTALETFEAETEELPGILGMDLGMQGYGSSPLEWTDADFSRFVCEVVDYTAGGGIFTVSVHYDNPSQNYTGADASNENWCKGVLGYTDTKEGYEQAFADLITDGTDLNDYFKKELDANAKFFKALKDNGVPVLFRPLHEMNGNWFWWNTTQNGTTISAESYKNLWEYLYNYYTTTWGLDNLVWVYSPNVSSSGLMSTMYNYPGDEYVDIVGVDWYTKATSIKEIENSNCYTDLVTQSGKVGAICEFGPSTPLGSTAAQDKAYNMMDVYDDLMTLVDKGYKFAYMMNWTNKGQWGISSMGHGFEFMQEEYTLGQADVYELFQALNS